MQLGFSLSTLFVIFTSLGLKLCIKCLHPKQYVVPGFFPIFISFIFDCVFFFFCNLVKGLSHADHFNFFLFCQCNYCQLFFKVVRNFINHLINCFFLRNFDMYKFILPTNLKRSKLGSLGLHRKILKLCFLNMSPLSFSSSES